MEIVIGAIFLMLLAAAAVIYLLVTMIVKFKGVFRNTRTIEKADINYRLLRG